MVAVVPEELELLDESSFFAQEMMMRLINVDRKRNKIFFIFSPIPKVKYGCFVKETTLFYHKFTNFTRIGDFTLRVSDCEELMGVTHRR